MNMIVLTNNVPRDRIFSTHLKSLQPNLGCFPEIKLFGNEVGPVHWKS